jgi:two-component system phosphate regulon sensor histidine kinase PhoR
MRTAGSLLASSNKTSPKHGDSKEENLNPMHNMDLQTYYKFVVDSLPVAVVSVDAELKITGFNPWAEKLTGYSKGEVKGSYCGKILQGGMCLAQCPLKMAIDGRDTMVQIETTVQNRLGEVIPVRMNTAALLGDDGRLLGGVEAFQDISRIKTLERERSNFMSMIAHDMKSSLVAIGGFVLRLLNQGKDMEENKQDRYLGIIRDESTKLEALINDFLEFSRIQTGTMKFEFGPTSLDKELMELLEVYEPKTRSRGIELILDIADDLPVIQADAKRLRRVFTNLLDNAIKFTKEPGKIMIQTKDIGESILIKVKDQGVGIAREDLPRIFDAFHRGEVNGHVEGFGLGLASVRAIVEGHRGRVFAESELGKGSVFTVVLNKQANNP